MSLKYSPVTQSTLYLSFLICEVIMHHWTTVDKNLKQFAVYDSDIRVTLKWYELIDPKQG